MKIIHRAAMRGTRCGELGLISTSGVGVTCPRCLELTREPTRAEKLAALREAIRRLREDQDTRRRN